MAKEKKLKYTLNPRTIIIILVVFIGMVLLAPRIAGLEEALVLLTKVRKPFILLALLFEFVSYCGAAALLGVILSRLNFKVRFWDRFRIGSIAAFSIHFLPIGTVGEGALDYYFLRRKKVSSGAILLTLVLRVIVTYGAFLLVLLSGLLWVPAAGAGTLAPKVAFLTIFILILAGVIYMILLYRNKEGFKKFWLRFYRATRYLSKKISKKDVSRKRFLGIFEEIYAGMGLFGTKKRFSFLALLFGLVYWLGDIFCFYFVFMSFGYQINFGVLVLGYSIATLAGIISFIPGGFGVTEGSMGLVFASFGIPLAVSVTSIIIFRLFSFWIWIPIGLYSYVSLSRESSKSHKVEDKGK